MPESQASTRPATRVGVISDTHGDVTAAATAVKLLLEASASALIHLGDVGSDAVLEELVAFRHGPVHLVFGNCDDAPARGRHATRLGLHVHHPAGLIEVDGIRVGFTHGHLIDLNDAQFVQRFMSRLDAPPSDGRVDVLLHGHTHVRRDESLGTVRVINPGALHRAPTLTVAVLEPATGRLETLVVKPAPRDAGGFGGRVVGEAGAR